MIRRDLGSLTNFEFENLSARPEVRHFVTARLGGASPPPHDSLNLGFRTADDPSCVLANRQLLSDALGIQLDRFTVTKQVHGDRIEIIGEGQAGLGARDYESGMDETDALMTNVPGICVMVLVADCVPILLFDPAHMVVAAVHSGWKGTVARIGAKAVRLMAERFGSRASDIIAGIGPSIGPCCYEVGHEVESAFGPDAPLGHRKANGRAHLDLWEANRRILLESGVPDAKIEIARLCTRCNADLFFSERHHPGTGRFGAGIMLLP